MARVALVTGSGRGIGKAIALKLAEAGYNLAINFSRSEDAAAGVVNDIKALGVKAEKFKADVSDLSQVQAMFKDIKSVLGGVEILINNAGITRDNLLMRMKPEDWAEVINANLNSVFNCTREAIRDMAKARFGRIINIASVVGLIGNSGQANYAASKAGIIGFTKAIAREYAARGITANAIAPGFIATSMTEVLKPDVKDIIAKQIPAGHIGSPEDVANAAAFLASDDSAYITGQVLAVDGGLTMC